ncbi:MAG: hypothetical protein C0596_17615 [Marinilabiliales bacterium]|nr:MAG: hypothetical protein C0596_17615 [Marinilabiliales bacterium]
MRRYFVIFLLPLFAIACKNDTTDFEKHESGLEYKIITSTGGEKAKVCDVLILNFEYETKGGKVIFNSADSDRKYLRKLETPKHTGGSIEDGLAMLAIGDSAIFRLYAESFLKFSELYSNMPDDVEIGDKIIIKVKLLDILKNEEFDSHISEQYYESFEAEMKILEKYLKNASIDVEPSESGLYYIEKEKGSGDTPKSGDYITVNYTVKLIDGFVLETTFGNQPFTFEFGTGNVIDALEEGLGLMKVGGKADFICPSNIAYGAKGTKDIPPYSTLIFEVELVSIAN